MLISVGRFADCEKELKNNKEMDNEDRMKALIEEAVARAIAPFLAPRRPVLLSREAVCARLKKDKSTLYRWSKSGYLPVSARIGGECYYDEEAVRRLESGEIMR